MKPNGIIPHSFASNTEVITESTHTHHDSWSVE